MTNVEFLKNWNRMCKEVWDCDRCLLDDHCGPEEWEDGDLSKIVSIVEKWAAEHPVKTRQTIFLKAFPNAATAYGTINILPCRLDKSLAEGCNGGEFGACIECKEVYWNEEVE